MIDDIKKYRLIKGCDLQLYEGVSYLFHLNSESQTEEDSFEY